MKKGLIFATTLAMALGVGVAVGAHQGKAAKAEAENSYGSDWWITGTVGGKSWGDFQKISTHNSDLGRYEIKLAMTTSSEFKIYNHAAYGDFELNRSSSKLDYAQKGWLTYTDWAAGDNFKMKAEGDFIIWFDEYIEDYDDVEWAFGIEEASEPAPTPKQDPSATKVSYYVYDKAAGLGAYSGVKVYGFDPNEVYEDMTWPGVHEDVTEETLGSVEMYEVKVSESYSSFIMNGNSKQTVNIDATDHVGDVYIISDEVDGEGHYIGRWEEASYFTDVPAAEGYYIHSSAKSWVKANATLMGAGDSLNHARAIRYSAVKDEEFVVFAYFDNDFTYFHDHDTHDNYKVAATGLINVDASKDGDMYVEEGVPAADGYYLQKGHKDEPQGWSYDEALVMTETSQDGNKAYYLNMSAEVDDEIRVRSYFVDKYPHLYWASVGKDQGTSFGTDVDGNFRFSKKGSYDIYAKEENDLLVYYISEAAVIYNVQMTGVKFVGKDQEGEAFAQPTQLAYSDQNFEPVQPEISGYALEGYFTDPECETAYVPHKFEADGHLYAKYMKIGYYVISGAGNWKIENAVAMETQGVPEGNKAEATVVVAAKNETYSFVYYDGEMAGQSGLGEPEGKPYTFAVEEEDHIKFTETGTYRVYWAVGDNKIYLNTGATAFSTGFITATDGVCKEDGKGSEYETSLHNVWVAQKTAFLGLDDGAKSEIRAVGFNGGKEDGSALERFMARYHYIVCKYGSSAFENFVFPEADPIPAPSGVIGIDTFGGNNSTMIIVITIAAISALAFTTLLVFKKRKQK